MFHVRHTDVFAKWLKGLKDAKAKARILVRLESVRIGNLGDTKTIVEGVREL